MRRQRKAKILATLGPATSTHEQIAALFHAGADVFRLNFSHGSHEDHQKRYDLIREIEDETGRPIGVLMDLQGPKLRVGQFGSGSADLKTGAKFRFDLDEGAAITGPVAVGERVKVTYQKGDAGERVTVVARYTDKV